ncbi:MAG: MotA/TolQ/ExbB proton channel family protein [Thermoanaerobaculia bacterium]
MIQVLSSMALVQADSGLTRPGMFDLLKDFGPMGWLVAATLVFLSFGSWSIMVGKFLRLRRAAAASAKFLDGFRRSQRFSEVKGVAEKLQASPLVGIFQAGYVEIDAQVKAYKRDPDSVGEYRMKSLDALQRTLRRALAVEQSVLGRGVGFLATTAAASPFIGLFGTVWGIMVAFQDIGITGSTSLVAVAPGIAEALVNTALGLAAAIPALVGFNYFSYRARQFRAEMEDFILEFINLAERNFT